MKTYTFLIKVFPHERFFFGSNRTFGHNNEDNYFVRSQFFPQQTTLLGMLRYLLLKANGLMDANGKVDKTNDADGLIGRKGFNHTEEDENFGCIQSISPVFIHGPDGDYMVQSREYGANLVTDSYNGIWKEIIEPLALQFTKGSYFNGTFKNGNIPYLSNLTSKTIFPNLLVNLRSSRMRHFLFNRQQVGNPMNGIFIEGDQVGIDKKKNENAFFRQVAYQMHHGYCFAFFAKFTECCNIPFDKPIDLPMGGDASWFRVAFSECNSTDSPAYKLLCKKERHNYNDFKDNVFNNHNSLSKKIVLLSDTFLERDTYNNLILASASSVPFSYMVTDSSGGFNRGSIRLKKVEQNFELLQRGSVLFVEQSKKESILVEIEKHKAFRQIGYNYAI